MFNPSKTPRVFGLAPGVNFPKELVKGLIERTKNSPPEDLARTQIIVNTTRMAARIRELFDQESALLLPQIRLVSDLGGLVSSTDIPSAVSPLRRRLELSQLISRLLEQQPDLAPRAALYDLSDSLAGLLDEMHSEGVSPDVISGLDISDESGHWKRATTFLDIVQTYLENTTNAPSTSQRQMTLTMEIIENWNTSPPKHPIIIAGSTGSRGATFLLMQAVAKLPQGALVLPGFDFDMPSDVWSSLEDAMISQDHPQYRFLKLVHALGVPPNDVSKWTTTVAPCPERNQVVSLALRPAPVTDQWLTQGPLLPNLSNAMGNVSVINAPSSRDEAVAIAMRLRKAAQDGQTAALVTPDRMLTRQVYAALQRWNIIPDDSAGSPLQLSPSGRFLRHVASLFYQKLTSEALIVLLKHPLTHHDQNRGLHQLNTQNLELYIRKKGNPFPNAVFLRDWAQNQKDPNATVWVEWVIECFVGKNDTIPISLLERVRVHIALAEKISRGEDKDADGALWNFQAGKQTQKAINDLLEQAPFGGEIDASDYVTLFNSILQNAEGVRDHDTPHPKILILGTMEARIQGADLVILGGLNDGIWPQSPSPDPWLNRKLRYRAGLLLPERRIGLAAHDFQQAIAANEVWLTRSMRSSDAETVASRWLNRLTNMLGGLTDQDGPNVLDAMEKRGQKWLARALVFQDPGFCEPAPRPSPKPPKNARPKHLSVTEIKRLIRDPYSIYAKHVLRLRPLNPIQKLPDALMRGIVIHSIFENFVKAAKDDPQKNTKSELLRITDTVLGENVPWPHIRALWKARMERSSDWFIATEKARISVATPAAFEIQGQITIPDLEFTLTATADRIDRDIYGGLHIYDYKSGNIPSPSAQKVFDKQLLLEAVIATRGGFENMAPASVERALFLGLNSRKEGEAPLDAEPPEKVWEDFLVLISAYLDPSQGFTARRAMFKKDDFADYDELSRFGEWDITSAPLSEDLI